MLNCWQEFPDDRPTFTDLTLKLEEMMMRNNPYFDPNSVDESRDYYHVPSFKSIEDSDQLDPELLEKIFGGKIDQDQDASENVKTETGIVNENIEGVERNEDPTVEIKVTKTVPNGSFLSGNVDGEIDIDETELQLSGIGSDGDRKTDNNNDIYKGKDIVRYNYDQFV